MAKIKALIFDLGNCTIGFDHRIGVRKILEFTAKSEKEIYDFFFNSPLTQDFERGKYPPEDFFNSVKTALNLRMGYGEFVPVWSEIFFSLPEMEGFIKSLPGGLKRILLSNINILHYQYIESEFSATLSLFDKIIASYTTGFIKPERQIYDLAIAAAGEDLESIIYVDDRLDLIEAARGYGINSIQFQGVDNLRQEFKKAGVNG